MTEQGRIVLLYRRARCTTHAERLLAALDHRYHAREVVDLALDEDAPGLDGVGPSLCAEDLVLVLVDQEWDDVPGGMVFGRASTLFVAVEGAPRRAQLSVSAVTWEADLDRLLDEVDIHLGERAGSTSDGSARRENLDELFVEAAELQNSGLHQDAVSLFQTIIRSDTPELAGRAAYAAGRSYERLRDSNHAVQAYRTAISLGPGSAAAAAAYGLGRLLRRRGEFDEAAAAFGEAIEFGDASMRARAEELRDGALRKAAGA